MCSQPRTKSQLLTKKLERQPDNRHGGCSTTQIGETLMSTHIKVGGERNFTVQSSRRVGWQKAWSICLLWFRSPYILKNNLCTLGCLSNLSCDNDMTRAHDMQILVSLAHDTGTLAIVSALVTIITMPVCDTWIIVGSLLLAVHFYHWSCHHNSDMRVSHEYITYQCL